MPLTKYHAQQVPIWVEHPTHERFEEFRQQLSTIVGREVSVDVAARVLLQYAATNALNPIWAELLAEGEEIG